MIFTVNTIRHINNTGRVNFRFDFLIFSIIRGEVREEIGEGELVTWINRTGVKLSGN